MAGTLVTVFVDKLIGLNVFTKGVQWHAGSVFTTLDCQRRGRTLGPETREDSPAWWSFHNPGATLTRGKSYPLPRYFILCPSLSLTLPFGFCLARIKLSLRAACMLAGKDVCESLHLARS